MLQRNDEPSLVGDCGSPPEHSSFARELIFAGQMESWRYQSAKRRA
jgi:hypothetical protein